MLVVSRKVMQSILIGDHIRVTVVRLEAGQVRLGVEAPREISIIRGEKQPERDPIHVGLTKSQASKTPLYPHVLTPLIPRKPRRRPTSKRERPKSRLLYPSDHGS